MKRAATVEVHIRNIAFGGEGVGEVLQEIGVADSPLQGITAFIPYAAIGERIVARVEERKKNHIRCEAGERTHTSPERIDPPCPHFTHCGGCHFQHLETSTQAEVKRLMVVNALRAARCPHTVLQAVAPIVQSQMYGYRRRVRLHVNPKGEVGFYQPRSRIVLPITDCLVAEEQIRSYVQKLPQLQEVLAGVIGSILLESDEEGVLAVLVAPFEMNDQEARAILQKVKHLLPNCSLQIAGKERARIGRRLLKLALPGGVELSVPAGGFSQANWPINQALVSRCLELLKADPNERLYDFYSGAGNFSLPALTLGKKIVAVEQDRELVQSAQSAAKAMGAGGQLRCIESSVEAYCKKNRLEKSCSVLADPPRSGLGSLVNKLQGANSLYFISCHLPSFVRDLRALLDLGWRSESIEVFDMFPQTTHMEILGVFRK